MLLERMEHPTARIVRPPAYFDPYGLQHGMNYRESTDSLEIFSVQICDPILEINKALRNDGDGYTPSRDMQRVASIPMGVVHNWLTHGINVLDPEHWPYVAARLDDPAYRHLRTAPGRISTRPKRDFYLVSGTHSTRKAMQDAL